MHRDLPSQYRGSRCNLNTPTTPLHVIINNHKHNALALFPYHHCAAVAVVACAGQPPLRQALLPSGLQERSPLQAVTLAAGLPLAASQRAAAPCGRCLWALVVVGRPLVGGLGRNQPGRGWPALHGGWSWLVTPPPRCLWRD
ncbi:hypothetical protein BHE74_00045953 [Ensete ventricosum]|nr:hypothetical protein BHE74_00045953 [Ensete ventricosum]